MIHWSIFYWVINLIYDRAIMLTPSPCFYITGLVKFFGAVAYLVPKEVCQQHPSFLSLVFSLHENHDPSTRGLAAETVGMVGRKIEGKHLLEQQGESVSNMVNIEVNIYIRHGVNFILSIPIPLNSIWSIPPQIYQFQNFQFQFGFFSDTFCLIFFTMSRYSEYLFGIHTLSSLYSK